MGRSTKEPQEDMQEKHQVLQNLIEKNKQDTWNQKPFEWNEFDEFGINYSQYTWRG